MRPTWHNTRMTSRKTKMACRKRVFICSTLYKFKCHLCTPKVKGQIVIRNQVKGYNYVLCFI